MELRSRVVSALKWSALGRILGQTFTWASTILVIRLLVPEDYALIAISSLIIGFTALIRELGLGAAIIQRDDVTEDQMRSIFGVVIALHTVLFLMVYILAPVFATFFEEKELVSIIRVAALQLPIFMFMVIPQALMYRAMRFKWISLLQLTSMVAASLTTLAMAYSGYGVWSLIAGQLAATFTTTIGYLICAPYFKWPLWKINNIRALLSYSFRVFGADLFYYIYTRADVVIVGKLLGATALGFYSVSYNLATLPMNKISGVLSSVGFSAYPKIKNDIAQVKSNFLFTIELNSLVFFPVLWGMSSVADDFVLVLLGSKWLDATVVLQLITLIIPLQMTAPLIRPALLGIGRADLFMSNIVTNAICIPAAIAVGSHWGLSGVCFGWIGGFCLAYLINLRRTLPVLDTRFIEFGRIIAPAILITLTMCVAVAAAKATVLTDFSPIYRLILSVLIGAGIYGGLLIMVSKPTLLRVLSLTRA